MIFDKKIAEKTSKILLKIKAVSINTTKPFRYTSGMLSPMYTDNRLLMSHPAEWKRILAFYVHVIRKAVGINNFDVLSGTATAAIPHTAALAYLLKKPMVYVRSSKKEHGKENTIEGSLKKGSRVLVIEDLVSTGKSSAQNINAIRKHGCKVSTCVSITSSTRKAFVKAFDELKVELFTLSAVDNTVEVALKEKLITAKQRKIIELFLNDPPNWGKAMGFE